MMQPLKITAVMQDGRIAATESYFPLDSILAAEWMRRNHPEAFYNASSYMLTHEIIIADLPFEKRGVADDWYWACSFNQVPKQGEYILHWHKRIDDQLEKYINFKGKRGRINTKSDKYKAYRMPLVIQLFDRLEWYAMGELDAIGDLCQTVTTIGKKAAQGLGYVDYWQVESWAKDLSYLRALPDEKGNMQYGIRPPYWHIDHQRLCRIPEVYHGQRSGDII